MARAALPMAALVAAIFGLACSSSPRGPVDAGAPAEDAPEDASDAEPEASDSSVISDAATGPYPSEDAPEFGPDGCALNSIACTQDRMCCSGVCNQGECASPVHPADRPER